VEHQSAETANGMKDLTQRRKDAKGHTDNKKTAESQICVHLSAERAFDPALRRLSFLHFSVPDLSVLKLRPSSFPWRLCGFA
jgi:hypothetical protein